MRAGKTMAEPRREERVQDRRPEFDPLKAIDWALDHGAGSVEAHDFLLAWREGALGEFPEFVAWARKGGEHG